MVFSYSPEQHEALLRQSALRAAREPRIKEIAYDPEKRVFRSVWSGGHLILTELRFIPELRNASPSQIKNVKIIEDGYALNWKDIDVQVTAKYLLLTTFNLPYTQSRSEASRANGAKGGRPRKQPLPEKSEGTNRLEDK